MSYYLDYVITVDDFVRDQDILKLSMSPTVLYRQVMGSYEHHVTRRQGTRVTQIIDRQSGTDNRRNDEQRMSNE